MKHSGFRRLCRTVLALVAFLASGSFFHYSIESESASLFHPIPSEDTYNGRNSNAYLPAIGGVSEERKRAFVAEVAPYAVSASARWGIPASAIIGMAIHESGYGTTRIAHYANNLFGIKVWGVQPDNAWQLKGQPLEDDGRTIAVLKDLGNDRKIYDESARADNWYRMFAGYAEAVDYLAGEFLQKPRYLPAGEAYRNRLAQGWNLRDASLQYVYDIAQAGYNHLGGEVYRKRVGGIMDEWNLYRYDVREEFAFADTIGHWAREPIERLARDGIVSGFGDGTFRPDEPVTREQFLKMAAAAVDAHVGAGATPFADVPEDRWSAPYISAAVQMDIVRLEEHDGTMEPGEYIPRQEMAAYAARAAGLEPAPDALRFADRGQVDAAFADWIGAASRSGIITGFLDGTFRPRQWSTRAQAAAVIARMLDRLDGNR